MDARELGVGGLLNLNSPCSASSSSQPPWFASIPPSVRRCPRKSGPIYLNLAAQRRGFVAATRRRSLAILAIGVDLRDADQVFLSGHRHSRNTLMMPREPNS